MSLTIDRLPSQDRDSCPYYSRFIQVNGRRMHYVDEGPVDAVPVLLLHGNPTWGYLWPDVIPPLLAAGHRVVVPDMIGMGLSEKPHDWAALTLDNHTANLVALLDRLELHQITVVCHDWGGPIGLGAALTRPLRVAGMVVMSTWASSALEFHRMRQSWSCAKGRPFSVTGSSSAALSGDDLPPDEVPSLIGTPIAQRLTAARRCRTTTHAATVEAARALSRLQEKQA